MARDGSAAIEELTTLAEGYHARILELEDKKKEIEIELPQLRANLEACNKVLALVRGTHGGGEGESKSSSIPAASVQTHAEHTRGGSIAGGYSNILMKGSNTEFAYKPLKMSQLCDHAVEKQPNLKPLSFQSGIYRLMKKGKVFRQYDGKIGLLEWK